MNPVSGFDYFNKVQENYEQSQKTIYWLRYAGKDDVKFLNPKWVKEVTIIKDGDLFDKTKQEELM